MSSSGFSTFVFIGCALLGSCSRDRRPPAAVLSSPAEQVGTPGPSPAPVRPVGELSHALAAGTVVPVELQSAIDSVGSHMGYVGGRVSEDVKGTDGGVALPSGSGVTIAIRQCDRRGTISTVVVGLYSVNVGGKQYAFSDGHHDFGSLSFMDDAGKGTGHNSVHLQYGYPLDFKLDSAVQLR